MQKAVDIINGLDISNEKKQIFRYYAECFDSAMPDSLYMNYYELAEMFPKTEADLWEEFLDLPEVYRYVQAKVAKLQEFAAKKALRQLEDKAMLDNAGAISALKEIMEKSKMIQQSAKRKQQIVLTYMPEKRYENG